MVSEPNITVQHVQTPVTLDDIAPLGRIGVLSLATDFNIEQDLRRIFPPGFEILTNRITNANPLTIGNLRAMAGDVTRAAAGILPGYGIDAIIYGCTSGTIAIGNAKINELVHAAWPGIPVTNPVVAAHAAFDIFNARKISVLTPYSEEVNTEMGRQFLAPGYQLLNIAGFDFENDTRMTLISPETIHRAALEICDPQADLLFISCTALRASLVIEKIEQDLGKPVVSSNQALAWHIMQLLDRDVAVQGFGSLFRTGCQT